MWRQHEKICHCHSLGNNMERGAFGALRSTAKADPIPVLLVDGQSGGPYHAWQLTTAVLKKELEDAGIFSVTVATSPKFGEDFSSFKPEFSKYRAIVLNYDAPDWPANLREQLENYVKNGGGLVIVHAADNSFPDWPAYQSDDRHRRLARPNREGRPDVVFQGRQAGLG